MAVDSRHPEYVAAAPQWSRARDVLAGDPAANAAAPTLPVVPATAKRTALETVNTNVKYFLPADAGQRYLLAR